MIILPTVYVILNSSFVSKIPIKVLHFYQPTILIILYAVFTGVYQELGGKSYQSYVLDWRDSTKSAITLVFMVVIAPCAIQSVIFGLYKFRVYLISKCSKTEKFDKKTKDRIHRDTTTTDVVLEETNESEFVDVNLNIKDDSEVKPNAQANGDAFKRYNTRLFKSESDLRDYQAVNGFYCDFAKCNRILHHTHTAGDVFYNTNERDLESPQSDSKGSQIIVVKGCVKDESEDAVESVTDTSATFSEDIDDYLSNL